MRLPGLDPVSAECVRWTQQMLADPIYFIELLQDSLQEIKNYYSHDPKELSRLITNKMKLGAMEHGEIEQTHSQIKKEMNEELLDYLGWRMRGRWLILKKKRNKVR